MNKSNKKPYNRTIATLIIAASIASLMIASTTIIASIQPIHRALAQNNTAPTMTTNEQFNAAPTSSRTPSSTATQQSSATAPQTTSTQSAGPPTPPLNQNVVWQGSVSSGPSQLPGHEKDSVAIILPPRKDGGVYSGILTYQASKSAKVVVWNVVSPANKTAIPKEFGSQDVVKVGNRDVVLTTIGSSGKSGSVPFTGSAVELVNSGGGKNKDFTATYAVNVVATQARQVNNLQSLSSFNATSGSSSGSSSGGSSGGK
jgi:hypothetical protein